MRRRSPSEGLGFWSLILIRRLGWWVAGRKKCTGQGKESRETKGRCVDETLHVT